MHSNAKNTQSSKASGLVLIPTMSRRGENDNLSSVFLYDIGNESVRDWNLPLQQLHSGLLHPSKSGFHLVEKDGERLAFVSLDKTSPVKYARAKKNWFFSGHLLYDSKGTRLLVSEYNPKNLRDSSISVRDAQSLEEISRFESGGVHCHEMAWQITDQRLVVGHYGLDPGLSEGDLAASVTFIDFKTGKKLHSVSSKNKNLSLCHVGVTHTGLLVAGTINALKKENSSSKKNGMKSADGRITTYTLLAGPVLFDSPNLHSEPQPKGIAEKMIRVGSVAVDHSKSTVAMTHVNGRLITLWDLKTAKLLNYKEFEKDRPTGIALTRDKKHFIVATSGGNFYLLAAQDLREQSKIRPADGQAKANFHLSVI